MSIKRRVFEILEASDQNDKFSLVVDLCILVLISLNVLAVVLETVDAVYARWSPYFDTFEVFSIGVFSIEYLLRVWSCTTDARYRQSFFGRLRFILSPMGAIDLLAIVPFFVAPHVDLRYLRILRMFRLFRLAKVARYTSVLHTFGRVLRGKKEELITLLSFVCVLLLLSSGAMYFLEHEAQPDKFSSIPAAMWWGVTTLTTVSYGDSYPVTVAGKILASGIAILGIGLFALPAGILGSAFVEDLQKRTRPTGSCPHCGGDLNARPAALSVSNRASSS
jgi:voltage-gated potassium channel